MTPLSGETQGNHYVYFVIGQLCLHLALFIEEGIIIGGFFLVVAKAVRENVSVTDTKSYVQYDNCSYIYYP